MSRLLCNLMIRHSPILIIIIFTQLRMVSYSQNIVVNGDIENPNRCFPSHWKVSDIPKVQQFAVQRCNGAN